ncbi:DNA (cytosine-5)-methyltransferase 1 [Amycolatopsis sulphurea]|uniref:DNA (cytosine-5-)-methyltransferase n=1 Tax=Amycolatopsis sulphurea TaxID=76022 RepID=A0A2A9FZV1_9PSEU|nr:DNA cytosine methyltransferase [Amycolatopsis sulphurea]PFG56954.1 DNA (cytosine-5)-methyltransferase 1 [Amycolatopsis sulphurea]
MYTVTDLFCGAGGSGLGATGVSGVQLRMAANHSPRAIETHQANFPGCDHDCADISQVEPRRYARTNILWASPECTNHSIAKGRRRDGANQPGLFGEVVPDHVAERSRATMWDVVRFAEVHAYDTVIVENVVDAVKWTPFRAWLMAMDSYGYDHHIVSLNSMHAPAVTAPRAPQSRDRMYVVFWRKGNPRPDLDIRPAAWCPGCATDVRARQVFKPGRTVGRYRQQYLYRCPNTRCRHHIVEPYTLPAAAVIDWSNLGERIGDRARPLSDKTMDRIEAGLRKFAGVPQVITAGGSWNDAAHPAAAPLRTLTTREANALIVPMEGREGKHAAPAGVPLRTQTARHETALVVPYYGTGVARGAGAPMPTMTTVDTAGLAFIAELRGGGSDARHVREPLATVCASGNHHMLVHQTAPPAVEDCTFRMLSIPEIQAAMAFRPDYVVTGNKRERVRQLGNGVTPPAAEWLVSAAVAALERTATTPAPTTA